MHQMLSRSRSTSGAIILSIAYGIDANSRDDKWVQASAEAAHALTRLLVPGKFLADLIPTREYHAPRQSLTST